MRPLRRILAALALTFGAAVAAPLFVAGPAYAVEVATDQDGTAGAITLSALAVTFLVSLLLPIVTGLLTKYNAPGTVKGIVALAVSSINGLIVANMATDGGARVGKTAIVLAGMSFAIQTATYLGVYQPAKANAKLGPDFGIG